MSVHDATVPMIRAALLIAAFLSCSPALADCAADLAGVAARHRAAAPPARSASACPRAEVNSGTPAGFVSTFVYDRTITVAAPE